MIGEHERIVLTRNLLEQGLIEGDVGTVVHVHPCGEAFEVEFVALDGETAAIATLRADQVRAVHKHEITHARQMAEA
ncbi:MAG: DUF4926 domain-containing protein [Lentisphaerae bacterium]|nr:DUF4926 domain-containing protein [Lentisphaerota bacterium]